VGIFIKKRKREVIVSAVLIPENAKNAVENKIEKV